MSTATKPGTALSTRDEKFRTIKGLLTRAQGQIALALPKHLNPDRMTRIALSAMSKNPLLLECTPESLVLSLINLSEIGLEPDGRLAYLIPFNNWNKNLQRKVYECQVIVGYMGFIQLGYRSGLVSSIDAKAVHEKDVFDYRYGTSTFLDHRPTDDSEPGDLIAAYGVCAMLSGGHKFVVLNRRDVELRRAKSRGYLGRDGKPQPDSPWVTAEDAMWAKSAVRELYKWIPTSPEIARAVALDEAPDSGRRQLPENTEGLAALGLDMGQLEDHSTDEPEKTKSDRLADKLAAPKETAQPSPGEISVDIPEDHPLYALAVDLAGCRTKPEAAELKKKWTGNGSDPELHAEAVTMCDARLAELPLTMKGKQQKDLV